MKSGEKALVLYINHKDYPAVVYRIRQSLVDFLTMKCKDDADYPATLNALQEHGIVFQMNDAEPDYGEPFQAAFFLGVPAHAVMAEQALGNAVAFFFEWLHYKARQQTSTPGELPTVLLHNLSAQTDDFFRAHLTRFKHNID